VNVCVAIVKVPTRLAPELAAKEYETVPLPLPELPAVIVKNVELFVTLQAQPEAVTTLKLPLPALEVGVELLALSA
jgi:hypothetical protein